MKAIEIVRREDDASDELLGRLVELLAKRGTVGVVTERAEAGDAATAAGLEAARAAGATAAYVVGPAGWRGDGEDLSVTDALDRLAVTCDYGVVDGSGGTRLPTVRVGDDEPADGVLATVDEPATADLDGLGEAVQGVDDYETLESLVADVKRSPDEQYSGAIATFTGRVRAMEGPEDDRTEYLEFERYDGPARERMAAIADDLEAREGVYDVRLHHKTGVVEAGEDIVHVVVLAGHRGEAFAAVEDGIDRLKAEVPLFKKEVTETEEFWAHERPDRAGGDGDSG